MQGLVNVIIEHHPNIGDIISNRCLKVMFKILQHPHLHPSAVGPPWALGLVINSCDVTPVRIELMGRTGEFAIGKW
jgi:hypothetical protein